MRRGTQPLSTTSQSTTPDAGISFSLGWDGAKVYDNFNMFSSGTKAQAEAIMFDFVATSRKAGKTWKTAGFPKKLGSEDYTAMYMLKGIQKAAEKHGVVIVLPKDHSLRPFQETGEKIGFVKCMENSPESRRYIITLLELKAKFGEAEHAECLGQVVARVELVFYTQDERGFIIVGIMANEVVEFFRFSRKLISGPSDNAHCLRTGCLNFDFNQPSRGLLLVVQWLMASSDDVGWLSSPKEIDLVEELDSVITKTSQIELSANSVRTQLVKLSNASEKDVLGRGLSGSSASPSFS